MTEGVALIAADIAKWTGAPLIMGEWSLTSGSLGSGAKFTDVTLKQYANNIITASWMDHVDLEAGCRKS